MATNIIRQVLEMSTAAPLRKVASDGYEYKFKVIILGDSAVGKTQMVKSLHEGFVKTEPTVGVDMYPYYLSVDGTKILLQIWDTAGQERFRSLANAYFRGAVGALFVYSITDEKSFTEVKTWLLRGDEMDRNICRVLVGNKVDLNSRRVVPREHGEALARDLNIPYLETSALTRENIREVFGRLAADVLRRHRLAQTMDPKSKEFTEALRSAAVNADTTSGLVNLSQNMEEKNSDTNRWECC